jgi:hypothetical protein
MDVLSRRRGAAAAPHAGGNAGNGATAALAARAALRAPYAPPLACYSSSFSAAALSSAPSARASSAVAAASSKEGESEGARLSRVVGDALKTAAGGGAAGAVAMAANVGALMWVRTTVCFQYRCAPLSRRFATTRFCDALSCEFCGGIAARARSPRLCAARCIARRARRTQLPGACCRRSAEGALCLTFVFAPFSRHCAHFSYGMSTGDAFRHLYREGGVRRFYRGVGPALLQARFAHAMSQALLAQTRKPSRAWP